jgi:hypothetical protein
MTPEPDRRAEPQRSGCAACGCAEPAALVDARLDGIHGWVVERRHTADGVRFDSICPACRASWNDVSLSAIRVRRRPIAASR